MGHATMLCGICVLTLVCLLSISTAVADTTPQREVNCTAVLIEAEARRDSEVSGINFFLVKLNLIQFVHLFVCLKCFGNLIFNVLNSKIVCVCQLLAFCFQNVIYMLITTLYGITFEIVHVFINY